MAPKTTALVLLGAVSLLAPLWEQWLSGRMEPFSKYELATTLVSITLIFWWYHVDKRERGYNAGPFMNVGMVALSMVALPIYFVRSRGWKRGMIATGLAAAVLAAIYALTELGERIATSFGS
jgi:hypothetical protein